MAHYTLIARINAGKDVCDFQLIVPQGPGFGVTVDEEKLALYRRDRS